MTMLTVKCSAGSNDNIDITVINGRICSFAPETMLLGKIKDSTSKKVLNGFP